ncbi:hypothetical protein D3C87_2053650 [compost metagenome]
MVEIVGAEVAHVAAVELESADSHLADQPVQLPGQPVDRAWVCDIEDGTVSVPPLPNRNLARVISEQELLRFQLTERR